MLSRIRTVQGILAFAVLAVGGVVVAFGPLDPPAGPVSPTYKTLVEVEPRIAVNGTNTPGDNDVSPSLYRISQPGSYYLTGNVTGEVGKHGIEIVASGVTLDLNGFDLVGVPGMGFFSGVSVTAPGLSNIAVLNGSVRNWGGDAGVDLSGVFGSNNARVDGVRASGNAGNGILAGGGTVMNCLAYLNTGNGIRVLNGTVSHCSAFNNVANGINVGTGCTVADCVARLNTLDGIRCFGECVIRDNTCSSNGNGAGNGAGIHSTGPDNRIEDNHCTAADRGVDVDAAGNLIRSNTCSGNTTNWDIAANNYYGSIINRAGQNTAGYTGDGIGSSTIGTTDPHANFTY